MLEKAEDRTEAAVADREPALGMRCRFCSATADQVFVDLGMSPLCESYLSAEQLNQMEAFYPLRVHVCPRCLLVQLSEYVSPQHIFSEYAYFSSYSTSWVEHARAYTEMIRRRLDLTDQSLVVEIASNDGYLLQHFVAAGIPVLGIEPAVNVAEVARRNTSDARQFLRHGHRARTGRARRTGGPARRQQRAGACARSERFRGRDEDRAQAARRDHHGVSSSHAADGRKTSSIRSITSISHISRFSPWSGSSPPTA